ncbi:MAG: hypothetical protein P4K78_12975 [Terracidiphilus sp.]|nr:hypothetical protein [Terracidiphilus sp.]
MTKKALLPYFLLVLAWTAWRIFVLSHTGLPQPSIHDEFGYLLGGDTLAHGRLANPPHALAEFFESPHELVRPMYAMKYPPALSMFLALGQVIFGAPFYGVLLSNVFMLSAFCLMLWAWVPLRAGMIAATFFALILSPTMYWTDSYYGGSVTAGAAAVILLAVGLYRQRPTLLAGALFAAGALLLFLTRPYEGGVFTLAVIAVFAGEIWRCRRRAAFAVALVVLAAGAAWTCCYNKAVTGKPFLLPYMEHQRQYDVAPVLWFLPLAPQPDYHQPRLAALHGNNGWEVARYRDANKWPWWQRPIVAALKMLWTLSLGLLLALTVTFLVPIAWSDPVFRKMAVIACVFLAALSLETFVSAHYTAASWPAAALLIALWTEHAWRRKIFKSSLGVLLGAMLLLSFGAIAFRSARAQYALIRNGRALSYRDQWPYRRAAMMRSLSALDRPQLVIVRYPSLDWDEGQEWVYNGADFDRQRVVFAHDFGAEKDRALLNYYPDRTALLLTFDAVSGEDKLEPYPQDAAAGSGPQPQSK